MSAPSGLFPPRRFALLGCLLCALAGASSADASCGDWLASHGGWGSLAQVAGNAVHGLEHNARLDTAPWKLPCRGPSCQGTPDAPEPALPPRIANGSPDQHGCLLGEGSAADPLLQWLTVADDGALPPACRLRLDRPPRVNLA